MHRESSAGSLLLCLLDRQGRGVDPPRFMPFICKEEGMLPGPASDVQDRPGYLPSPDKSDELLLGPADVPGRCAPVCRIKEIQSTP